MVAVAAGAQAPAAAGSTAAIASADTAATTRALLLGMKSPHWSIDDSPTANSSVPESGENDASAAASGDVQPHVVEPKRLAGAANHLRCERLAQLLGELLQVIAETHRACVLERLAGVHRPGLQPAAHVAEPG